MSGGAGEGTVRQPTVFDPANRLLKPTVHGEGWGQGQQHSKPQKIISRKRLAAQKLRWPRDRLTS